ncbi:hypothetical protein MferCBS31731_002748 [Microsporum ferrugineum]
MSSSIPLTSRTSYDEYLDADSHVELLLGGKGDRRQDGWVVRRWCNSARNFLRDLIPRSNRFHKRRATWRGKSYIFRRMLKYTCYLIAGFIFVSVLEAFFYPSYQRPPEHYNQLRERIISSTGPARGNPDNEKIFIAANIVKADLIRGPWGASLLELVDILGEQNVFVSIYENDSGNSTSDALSSLQAKLPCNSSVVTGDHLELSSLPKTILPGGGQRTKRIAYLAEVRNRALRPLNSSYIPTSAESQSGFRHTTTQFNRVLFLNDIYFAATDAVQLLFSTNAERSGRADYHAACAIDFVANVMFYDTFVVRDTEGFGMGLMFFPWFAASGKAESRQAVLAESDAVQVRSCWGGMVAFDARIFQNFEAGSSDLVMSFRHEPEPFWEAAECCLIFADIDDSFHPLNTIDGTGVYINPFIRVAYTENTWKWLDFFRRYERIFANLQWIVSKIGYPEYNPRRLHNAGQIIQEKVWVNDQQHSNGAFKMVERTANPGGFCGQRRMFVMRNDITAANKKGEKNWEKISVPFW